MRKIIIAIDGYSATGKSSTAKQVATKLNYTYIDTGAMYRAVTYFFLKNKVDISDLEQVKESLSSCDIKLVGSDVFLNGTLIKDGLRSMEVSKNVSFVSANSVVREKLVELQRMMGEDSAIVMDGRDIGSVVFPNAELKLFMTADVQIRAQRRKEELERKNIDTEMEEIIENLKERDHIDSTRADSPLVQTQDAVEIDTSYMTLDQQIEKIVQLAKIKINEH
ncbi:MAG: (d)CMP kinase [Ekhidna sp.]